MSQDIIAGNARVQVSQAVAFVLRSTQQRPQTVAEVRAKLRARDLPDAVVDATLQRAAELGAIDDRAFAQAWVEDRGRRRGYGAARLREELRRRQVSEPLIDDALRSLEPRDDIAVATDLARRRLQTLPASLSQEAVARRLHAYLVRRGHPPSVARRVAVEVSGLATAWD